MGFSCPGLYCCARSLVWVTLVETRSGGHPPRYRAAWRELAEVVTAARAASERQDYGAVATLHAQEQCLRDEIRRL